MLVVCRLKALYTHNHREVLSLEVPSLGMAKQTIAVLAHRPHGASKIPEIGTFGHSPCRRWDADQPFLRNPAERHVQVCQGKRRPQGVSCSEVCLAKGGLHLL